MMGKQVNVFKNFNRFPYEHERRHATKLVNLCKASETGHYQACYESISAPPDDLECKQLGDYMNSIWEQQLKQRGPAKASLVLALFKCLFWDFIGNLLWTIVVRILLPLTILESLRRILARVDEFDRSKQLYESLGSETIQCGSFKYNSSFVEEGEYHSAKECLDLLYKRIVLLATCLFLSIAGYMNFTSTVKLINGRCGLKCRICLVQLIQQKSLRLHLATSIEHSSARTTSLLSNEVTFVEESNKYLVYILTGPLAISMISLWLTLTQVNWEPVICTLPMVIVIIVAQIYLPKFYGRTSRKRKEQTNKRIDVINTFLNSIKIVKMYSWESRFRERIQHLRELELAQIKKLYDFTLLDYTVVNVAFKVLPMIILLANMLLFNHFDPRLLFTTTMAFNLCRADGFLNFPRGLKCFSDLCTACLNIKRYLLLDEFKDDRTRVARREKGSLVCENLTISLTNKSDEFEQPPEDHKIKSIEASPDRRILDGLDVKLDTGELAIVCGPVGSGKSSLLLSLLGETKLVRGSIQVSEGTRFAYASQEPHLLADTLKNNILNGRPLDDERYEKVLHACSLRRDVKLLPNRDETLVGPKGVSLSGGQKARLNLARAIYSQADIYLLDDPLAAVDLRVARDIFDECIRKFLSGKTVVLATHQVQFISQADKVILLGRGSKPVVGAASEMMQREDILQLISQLEALAKNTTEDSDNLAVSEQKNGATDAPLLCSDKPRHASCRATVNQTSPVKGNSIYLFIMSLAFSRWKLILFWVSLVISCFFTAFSDYYFKYWAEQVQAIEFIETNRAEHSRLLINQWLMYAAITAFYLISFMYAQRQQANALRRAIKNLHNLLIESLFRAKMSFYDFCQTGELSSRYAGDFAIIDHGTLFYLLMLVASTSNFVASITCMALLNPFNIIPFVLVPLVCSPVAALNYWKLRSLMGLSKALRSPVYSDIAAPIEDLPTVRSDMNHTRVAKVRFDQSLNKLSTMSLLAMIYETQLMMTIKTLSLLMVAIMFYIVFGVFSDDLKESTTGTFLLLAIVAANSFPLMLEFGSVLETNMISFENVRKYTQLEPEDDNGDASDQQDHQLIIPSKVGTNESAPTNAKREWLVGRIVFSEVTMRYFKDEQPAIDRLSFTIEGGERVGVVGRTGAGKSSIISLIYRLYPFEGTISVDGIDIKKLKLADLRGSLGVIPQDPVLFNDTLRKNLDPFDAYSDEQVWKALEVVNLRNYVAQNLKLTQLNHLISEGGRNFSVGQRQLVCLARAVLLSPKVLLIDEATANVDAETDAFIQRTIRSQFQSSTIVTIAHRLNTVLDYDRVMVLEAGRMVEFDTVDRLLKLDGGVFRGMLEHCGGNGKQTNEKELAKESSHLEGAHVA